MITADLVRMRGIGKRFGRVTVLEGVDFTIRGGEVHILAGENGAGKSTLIKILGGIYQDFEGTVEKCGEGDVGVAVIHQELSLIGPMSVADNIFLGRSPARAGFVQDVRQREEATRWVRELGLEIDVQKPVETFPIAVQQLIEIAKALSQNARVMVMDEPTSALNAPEVKRLFDLIQTLKQRGCGIVYISHKMDEIERIANHITVLRDGKLVGSAPARELPPAKLISWMVGREWSEQFPRRTPTLGQERLRLAGFGVPGAARAIDLTVRGGEVVGLAGLQGSGASELLLGLFGAYGDATTGEAWLDNEKKCFTSPAQSIANGLGLLTNDRKATGLVMSLSIIANATLAGLRELSPGGWRRPDKELAAAEKTTAPMKLRAASLEMEVGALSGGNQQKVALAKWLQIQPKVLLLDEPTRGIDIAAKREIYQLIDELTGQGIALLLITSEMPELLTLSDRIIVLHRGAMTAEFTRQEASPEKILAAAMGAAA
jgi:ribose transport system ATP-binding protein